jgi:uncharacterized protein (DUF4415 family)
MTKYKEVDGIRYADGVEPAEDGPMDPDFAESLKQRAKIRITTMVDEDVYDKLKEIASKEGDGKYQTLLNQILRNVLQLDARQVDNGFEKVKIFKQMQKLLDQAVAQEMASMGKVKGKKHKKA